MNRYNIKAILFTDYKVVKEESERLVRFCEKKKIRMLLLPSIDELQGGKIQLRALPEVRIEDLLGREEIRINMEEIAGSLKGKVVLVTGAAGSIGSELCRQLCHFGLKQLVLFDSAETPMHNIRLELEEKFPDVEFTPVMGDIRMIHRVESIYQRFRPHIVFHAAAYKHVPLMEENPCEAVHTNVYGTRNVADMAVKYDVDKFIMVSTDKAVNPTNVMGASKRLAEMYVQSLSIAISKGRQSGKTRFITTRFGNVLGSNGSVIPRFREQLAKGGPLTVTHPTIIPLLHDDPRSLPLGFGSRLYGQRKRNLRLRYGNPCEDRRSGTPHDRTDRPYPRRGYRDQIYRPPSGRKALRRIVGSERKYITNGKRKDLPCPSPGIRLRRHLYAHVPLDRPRDQSRQNGNRPNDERNRA